MCSSRILTSSLVLFSVILVITIQSGSATECYECPAGVDCAKVTDDSKLTTITCKKDNTLVKADAEMKYTCARIVVDEIDAENKKVSTTRRGCLPVVENPCHYAKGTIKVNSDGKKTVSSCKTCSAEKCNGKSMADGDDDDDDNGAATVTVSIAALTSAVVAAIYAH